jgi:hypothetical protein
MVALGVDHPKASMISRVVGEYPRSSMKAKIQS